MSHPIPIEREYFLGVLAMRRPEAVALEDLSLIEVRLSNARRKGPSALMRKRAEHALRQRGYLPDTPGDAA